VDIGLGTSGEGVTEQALDHEDIQAGCPRYTVGIEKGEVQQFLSRSGLELRDHRDARDLEEMYFKDPAGRTVGRVNGTHGLARAVRAQAC